jgi:transposase-like protein
MDDTTCYCCNPRCPLFGATAPRSCLRLHAWQRHRPRFRCDVCGVVVSASTGTTYAGIRTDLQSDRRGATALAKGLSSRATARLLRVDKDPVNHWLPVLGRHG